MKVEGGYYASQTSEICRYGTSPHLLAVYAQLIANAASFGGNYGFVISRYKKLDDTVLDAYGWHHGLTDDEILERLVAFNLERAAGREGGTA